MARREPKKQILEFLEGKGGEVSIEDYWQFFYWKLGRNRAQAERELLRKGYIEFVRSASRNFIEAIRITEAGKKALRDEKRKAQNFHPQRLKSE